MSELEFFEKWIAGGGLLPDAVIKSILQLTEESRQGGLDEEEVKYRNIHALCLSFIDRVHGIDSERLIEILEAENARSNVGGEISQDIMDDIDPD